MLSNKNKNVPLGQRHYKKKRRSFQHHIYIHSLCVSVKLYLLSQSIDKTVGNDYMTI